MGRRTQQRYIKTPPENLYFKEVNKRNSLVLTLAEFEALRLKHYIQQNQKDAALNMGVSQPTFSRILETAHQKMTQAIMEGKFIKVSGGNIQVKQKFIGYGCIKCDHEWKDDGASEGMKAACPKCKSNSTYFLERDLL